MNCLIVWSGAATARMQTHSKLCLSTSELGTEELLEFVGCVAMPSLMAARWVGRNSGSILRRFRF